MPFPAHFQYQELHTAILQSLVTKPELLRQVQAMGNLGYSTKNGKNPDD